MHIPDGYLDLKIAGLFYGLSGAVIGYSIKKLREQNINWALVGIVAASIFAAQMLNWPIPGGTSAHFVGGALAGILLGPYAASIAMASVLTVQCLVFGDGGVTSLGANIWNMGIVDVFVGYYVYNLLKNKNLYLASFLAGWLGITLAAIFAGIELGLSSSFHYNIATTVGAMGFWHALLGIVEGIITASIVGYIASVRPDLLEKAKEVKVGKSVWLALAVMIILSPVFAYLAEKVNYSEPLENVAHKIGVAERTLYKGLFPDYTVPGINPYIGTLISAIVGVAVLLGLYYLINRFVLQNDRAN